MVRMKGKRKRSRKNEEKEKEEEGRVTWGGWKGRGRGVVERTKKRRGKRKKGLSG